MRRDRAAGWQQPSERCTHQIAPPHPGSGDRGWNDGLPRELLLGEDVLEAEPGALVLKPRGQWHAFWNAGDAPCRILEIIAPAGFEGFFSELIDLGGVAQADPAALGELCQLYALEMDPASVSTLLERFGVRFPAEPLPL